MTAAACSTSRFWALGWWKPSIGPTPRMRDLPVSIFGGSGGAPAAIVAAACRPVAVRAIVLRGGTPDVAGPALGAIRAPTLMIVGSEIPLRNRNTYAMRAMQ